MRYQYLKSSRSKRSSEYSNASRLSMLVEPSSSRTSLWRLFSSQTAVLSASMRCGHSELMCSLPAEISRFTMFIRVETGFFIAFLTSRLTALRKLFIRSCSALSQHAISSVGKRSRSCVTKSANAEIRLSALTFRLS